MEISTEPASDTNMLAGMEGLIAAMRGRRRTSHELVGSEHDGIPRSDDESDDRLAAAPWDEAEGELQHAAPRTTILERGAIVGRYVVIQKLGAGGMGVVHAAYDPELDRKVALKLLLPGTAGTNARTRLLREAQALAKVSHPNVVAIHDVGTVGEQVWVAMEFVQGRTLRRWLEGSPRTWGEALRIMLEAGRGLAAAHAADLLHRDFKPDNVMVGDDGRIRVMDFGLARVRPNVSLLGSEEAEVAPVLAALAMDVTRTGALLGTPSYMAPEQYGSADVTIAADQFAFCVTLWEALYGERPFAGRTLMELAGNVLAGRLRSPPKGRRVPSWLRRACERGLSVEPERRWPSIDALLDALAKGRTRAWIRKGLVAATVLALGGAGLLVSPQRDDSAQVDAIERHVDAARRAAARALYLYPPSDEPEARTAYVEVLELEGLEPTLGKPAILAATELRKELAGTLVRLGDRYWDSKGGRPFAVDYYIAALAFDPTDATARKRAPVTPGELTELRRKAAVLDFEATELSASEPLLALAEDDEKERARKLEELGNEDRRGLQAELRIQKLLEEEGVELTSAPGLAPHHTRERTKDERVVAEDLETVEGVDAEDAGSEKSGTAIPPTVEVESGPSSPGIVLPSSPGIVLPSSFELPPPSPATLRAQALVSEGLEALRGGRRQKAEVLFHRALDEDHKYHQALDGLAQTHFAEGEYDKAVQYGKRAVAMAPGRGSYRLHLGDAYFKVFRYREAQDQYRRAEELGHEEAPARLQKVASKLGQASP